MTITPSLAELLRQTADARLGDVHVALPGRVLSYNATTQTADVEPQVKRAIRADDGSKLLEDLPVIPSVPVAFLQAGSFFITFPLAAGTTGLLIFNERSIDTWRATGRSSDPGDQRPHGLSGAVFYPGLAVAADAIAGLPGGAMVVGGTEIRLGGVGASDFVSLSSIVAIELTKIVAAGTAAALAVVGGDGGAAAWAAFNASLSGAGFPASTSATKVKAE